MIFESVLYPINLDMIGEINVVVHFVNCKELNMGRYFGIKDCQSISVKTRQPADNFRFLNYEFE